MVFIQEVFVCVSALAWTMLLLAFTFLWVLHGVCVCCTAVLGCDCVFIGEHQPYWVCISFLHFLKLTHTNDGVCASTFIWLVNFVMPVCDLLASL